MNSALVAVLPLKFVTNFILQMKIPFKNLNALSGALGL